MSFQLRKHGHQVVHLQAHVVHAGSALRKVFGYAGVSGRRQDQFQLGAHRGQECDLRLLGGDVPQVAQLHSQGVTPEGKRSRHVLNGILSGVEAEAAQAASLDLQVAWLIGEGSELLPEAVTARLGGNAMQMTQGEEVLLGCLCKASGIATAARHAARLADSRVRVVCGAWKKMPPKLKGYVRQAVETGGLPTHILDEPFVYLDKNYVRLLGGISQTLAAVCDLPGVKVIQVRGYNGRPVSGETLQACQAGAGVVMVDTGRIEDALAALNAAKAYPQVKVAFAGGVQIGDIPRLAGLGVQILDIGAAIIDAPLLNIKLEVIENQHGI